MTGLDTYEFTSEQKRKMVDAGLDSYEFTSEQGQDTALSIKVVGLDSYEFTSEQR